MAHPRSTELDNALQIWHAGVNALTPARLLPERVAVDGSSLWIEPFEYDLDGIERIVIVGAGKAGAGMVVALEQLLGPQRLKQKKVQGWVNVPADCLQPTLAVHLHAARPAGRNEPTHAGVVGSDQILALVRGLGPRDLCLCLLSGGGSALLPAPLAGISLESKTELARAITTQGGNIRELNTLRSELSRIKGGRLARACRRGMLHALILSDVIGDELSLIASGPTLLRPPNPEAALQVLHRFNLLNYPAGQEAAKVLEGIKSIPTTEINGEQSNRIRNTLLGNNALAVDAAGIEAERLGYSHVMIAARELEGPVEELAIRLTDVVSRMRIDRGPDCLISGGESTVNLCRESVRGQGGRNQQFALASFAHAQDWREMALVSGGTDGEDGPTDAAGAYVDEAVARRAGELGLDAADYLARNDAYHFFGECGGLLRTGPTHTNVGDLRVFCVRQKV